MSTTQPNVAIPYGEIPLSTTASTEPPLDPSTSVDSALKAALREPRERVALLRLEASVVEFCKSDAGWMEVGGPYNSVLVGPSLPRTNPGGASGRQTSFQRCILHRLADRFGIIRENGSILDGSIRLIKQPASKVPGRLLQDLEPWEYEDRSHTEENAEAPAAARTNMNSSTSAGSGRQPPRKMKIMKRNSRNSSSGSLKADEKGKRLLQKSGSSVTEKERAYAEARARIFNDNGTETKSAPNSGNSGGGGSSSSSTNYKQQANGYNNNNNSGGLHGYHHTGPANNGRHASETTAVSPAYNNGGTANYNAHDLTSSSLENKAVYRNRVEEAADPDFQRGVMYAMPAAAAPYYQAYSMPPQHHAALPKHRHPQTAIPGPAPPTPAAGYFEKSSSCSSLPPLAANAPAFYPSSTGNMITGTPDRYRKNKIPHGYMAAASGMSTAGPGPPRQPPLPHQSRNASSLPQLTLEPAAAAAQPPPASAPK